MNPIEQAESIANRVSAEVIVKYDKGQREHGGDFFDKPTVSNIREEVLDLIAYTHVLGKHVFELKSSVRDILDRANDTTYTKEQLIGDIEKIAQQVHNL